MAIKKFGQIDLISNKWIIDQLEPHVCIRLKSIFPAIAKTQTVPFEFQNTASNCADLLWFMNRFPLELSSRAIKLLKEGKKQYIRKQEELLGILLPGHVHTEVALNVPWKAREYQKVVPEFHRIQKRFLLGDDLGTGKTLSGILTFTNQDAQPGCVVVQTHLPQQWKEEGIEKFTNLKTHIIKGTQPYNLPKADIYILKYSCLAGWIDFYGKGFFKSVIFDECQELRRCGSDKYVAATALAASTEYAIGMSATPIYNYGDEIYNVLNLLNPHSLGDRDDFLREWATWNGNHWIVKDTKALGTYLRDQHLILRRTREEIGRELPVINTIVQTVGYDSEEVKKSEDLAYRLAIKVHGGSFVERGQAARQLDAFVRHETGVAKAREVAAFVKMAMENGDSIVLAGWHRAVYDIWLKELAEYNPVLYTGSENPKVKNEAKRKFMSGETNLFIISLRSGIGLDGLQHRCKTVIFGELDWSPKVHEQVVGRVDRDGQKEQVTAYYLLTEYGSDPLMKKVLGLKNSQATGIMDPLKAVRDQYSNNTRNKIREEFPDVRMIELYYDGVVRRDFNFMVADYEAVPANDICVGIDTSRLNEVECITLIKAYT